MNENIIKVPLCDQYRDIKDKNWASKACGICAIKMLMAFYNSDFDINTDELLRRAVALGGYIDGIGWRHKALIDLASSLGINMAFQKEFPKTLEDKIELLNFINGNIENGKPVIVSIYHRFEKEKGGHLVIIHGLKKEEKNIVGYFIQDSDPTFRGNNYFVTKEEFIEGWRGGLIWLK